MVLAGIAVHVDGRIAVMWRDLANFLAQGGSGEPITLFKGVSIWPTQLIRATSFVLSLWFIFRGWRSLDRNLDDISENLMWQPERRALMKQLREERLHWPWWQQMTRVFSFRLAEHGDGVVNPATGLTPAAESFWRKYMYQGRLWARFVRVLVVTALYQQIGAFVIQSLGSTTAPSRGDLAATWNHCLARASVFAMLFLIFSVVDATVFCHQLLSALRPDARDERTASPAVATAVEPDGRWPQRTLDHYAAEMNVDKRYLDEWITMHFVARRTRVVASLVYYPFIIISLMVLSRSTLFDNWSTSKGLVVVMTGSVLIVMVCAILLRSGAEGLRQKAIWRLTNARIQLNGMDEAGRRTAGQLDVMIDQIRAFRSGAFAPYSQQPLVRALLLPLTSYGGAALVEYLSIANL